ncbi:MAG: hypothetical protein ACXWJW_11255 [Xanthobacteraceae bacterium]
MQSDNPRAEPGPDDAAAAADYIGELCSDLARMARRDGLDTLAYILDMERLEAQSLSQGAKKSSKQ